MSRHVLTLFLCGLLTAASSHAQLVQENVDNLNGVGVDEQLEAHSDNAGKWGGWPFLVVLEFGA